MTLFLAKLIWGLGVIGWFAIRFRHQQRSRKTPKLRRADRAREAVLLTISICGMLVAPLTYVISDQPKFATYPFMPWMAWLGAAVFALALWLFYRTHQDLGRNWSVTLEIREQHKLITTRHLQPAAAPDVFRVLAVGAGAGAAAAQLDRRPGRPGRVRHAVLLPDRAGGAADGRRCSATSTAAMSNAPTASFRACSRGMRPQRGARQT